MAGQVWILKIGTHDEYDYTEREGPDFETLLGDRSECVRLQLGLSR